MTSDDAGASTGADEGAGRAVDDDRWLVIDGRRWRRTDPSLPAEVVERLKSQLGRGRSAVRRAKAAGRSAVASGEDRGGGGGDGDSGSGDGDARDSAPDDALTLARRRVDLAKHGLGERGPAWWEAEPPIRLARAEEALRRLDALPD